MSEILNQNENIFLKFYKNYKKYVISTIFVTTLSLISLFIYIDYEKKKNLEISEEFYKVKILLQKNNKIDSKLKLQKIINKENIFYSPLSLNLYIENNFDNDKELTIKYFKKIIKLNSLEDDIKDLYKIKLVAYIARNKDDENEILNLIKPIINSKSVYKETALKFMEQYYLGKDELEKYKEFLNKK